MRKRLEVLLNLLALAGLVCLRNVRNISIAVATSTRLPFPLSSSRAPVHFFLLVLTSEALRESQA